MPSFVVHPTLPLLIWYLRRLTYTVTATEFVHSAVAAAAGVDYCYCCFRWEPIFVGMVALSDGGHLSLVLVSSFPIVESHVSSLWFVDVASWCVAAVLGESGGSFRRPCTLLFPSCTAHVVRVILGAASHKGVNDFNIEDTTDLFGRSVGVRDEEDISNVVIRRLPR